MTDKLTPTPEEAWAKISTPEKQADIIKGTVGLVMSMGLTPDEAGDLLSSLDDNTANGIAYLFGPADGKVVKQVGEALKSKD